MTALIATGFDETHGIELWIGGKSCRASIIWLSQTDAEIFLDEQVSINEGQIGALIVGSLISLPLRVRGSWGAHVCFTFTNPLHPSVSECISNEMPGAGIELMLDQMEERAMPNNRFADMEAWLEESSDEGLSDLQLCDALDCCGERECDCLLEAA